MKTYCSCLRLLLPALYLVLFFSCSDDGDNNGGSSIKNEKAIIPIYYSEDNGQTFITEYNAVRIGEYLWMNSNFTEPTEYGHEVTQHQINKGLNVYRIDTLQYILTPDDLNKYLGHYYSREKLEHMSGVGNMFEGKDKKNNGKWGLPSSADFRQLWGMCDDASEPSVRRNLCYKSEEIPLAQVRDNIFWMRYDNTNKYGFNLLYGGERAHNNNYPWGVCHDYPNDCESYVSNKGDFVTLYGVSSYPTSDAKMAVLEDYPSTLKGKMWAWQLVRWCRKLTDEELGYKLYVNKERSDIVKLGLNDTPPENYEILKKGYLRGFYVQYILDNPNPTKTVSQLRKMELSLPEVIHGTSPS